MKLKLGRFKIKALDGNTYDETIIIDRETPKAILLKIVKHDSAKKYWFPRSQITFSTNSIEIPDWLWEKREVA